MTNVHNLIEQRQTIWAQAQAILDGAEAEHRDLTAGEQARYDSITGELTSLRARIDRIAERAQSDHDVAESLRNLGIESTEGGGRDDSNGIGGLIRAAVRSNSMAPIDLRLGGIASGVNTRSLATTGNVGVTFGNQLVRHMVENSAILSAGATLLTTDSGESLKIPKTTADSSAAIVAEGDPIAASDPTLGNTTLGAFKYAFLTSITRELAEDNSFDVEGYISAQIGDALGNGLGAHLVNGNGTGQPAGILAAATTGVTGGTGAAGAFTADNLIDLYHSVNSAYARSTSAAWLMRNTTLAAVRKLKDSQNRYLFDLDVPLGYPGAAGTLLGRPVFVDPNVPAVALGAKSVLFGDMSKVFVRVVKGVRLERSLDYGFNTDHIYWRGILRADGALVDTTGAVKAFVGGAS
ncbi:phage major capsid protein [Tessaracoccus sp. G1721]